MSSSTFQYCNPFRKPSAAQPFYIVFDSTMFPTSYISSNSGPKSPLIEAWPPSHNFVSCLGEPSNASSVNAMLTMNMPKAKISKFHVPNDPNEIVELFNSQSNQVLKKQNLVFDGKKPKNSYHATWRF